MEKNPALVDVKYDFIDPPMIKFRDGDAPEQDKMANFGPYAPPKETNVYLVGINISEEDVRKYWDTVRRPVENGLKGYIFGGKTLDALFPGSLDPVASMKVSEDQDIIGALKNIAKGSLVVIFHSGMVDQDVYYGAKSKAIENGFRIQFIGKKHFEESDPSYVIFGIWVQLIAKCDGTPWILQNDPNKPFISNDTLIIGLSFTRDLKNNVYYGISHFLDVNNMNQEIVLTAIKPDFAGRSLVYSKDDITKILSNGLDWFNKNHSGAEVKYAGRIYLYKTTPLHPQERAGIESFIDGQNKKEQAILFSHIHVKSLSFGTPRIYNLENVGYANFGYMVKKGEAISIRPKTNAEGFARRGAVILATTGFYEKYRKPRGTLGTPMPLFLEIEANFPNALDDVERQAMAMTMLDWEHPVGLEYRNPFIIKYSRRMSKVSRHMQNFDKAIDIRDLL